MLTTKKTSQILDTFRAYMRGNGKRITPERIAILETIIAYGKIFSIDDIRKKMTTEAFPVATATVYNTVETLMAAGLVSSVSIRDQRTTYYHLNTSDTPQVYLVCEDCGAIKGSASKELIRFIRHYDFPTFCPASFTLTVYGQCSKCRKKTKTNIQNTNQEK